MALLYKKKPLEFADNLIFILQVPWTMKNRMKRTITMAIERGILDVKN